MKKSPEYFMSLALKEAKKAYLLDEVPVGAVIVKDDKVIAKGHNLREKKNDVTSHAEIEAIKKANKKLVSWRLNDCDIYVTLEPCMMCMGAILQSKIRHIYFGAKDEKMGALGGSFDILNGNGLTYIPLVSSGVLENESSSLLKEYFQNKRNK